MNIDMVKNKKDGSRMLLIEGISFAFYMVARTMRSLQMRMPVFFMSDKLSSGKPSILSQPINFYTLSFLLFFFPPFSFLTFIGIGEVENGYVLPLLFNSCESDNQ